MPDKRAIIIGAGPAGLTTAWELLNRTEIQPIILEKSKYIGGISKTLNYKGNRIDIGGHRFFSKSERVMNWWFNIMPLHHSEDSSLKITYHNKSTEVDNKNNTNSASLNKEKVMLIRERLSRIYYKKKFFSYPINLSWDTIHKLGAIKIIRIALSYLNSQLFGPKKIASLEDFFINNFGNELYQTFFKDYTEKVWGVSCKKIPAEWGAQRIRKLTVGKAIWQAVKTRFKDNSDISHRNVETSLIERFLYPKLGPGQLWEEVAQQVEEMGGKIWHHRNVRGIRLKENKVISVVAVNSKSDEQEIYKGDYFFSTMPVKNLIKGMTPTVPSKIREIAEGLMYRDFIMVGLLLTELKVKDEKHANKRIKDNWIYIQERGVKLGRLQIFNNWSPHMVKNNDNVWIGLEYFCNKGDWLWEMNNAKFTKFAIKELVKIDIIKKADVLDSTIHREEKTYPSYFGSYDRFDEIKEFVDQFGNLFLLGRNGMHRYNNSDHSMLTAMKAVDNIVEGRTDKENIWSVNTEEEYHEEK